MSKGIIQQTAKMGIIFYKNILLIEKRLAFIPVLQIRASPSPRTVMAIVEPTI
jgi:hypothetical protein